MATVLYRFCVSTFLSIIASHSILQLTVSQQWTLLRRTILVQLRYVQQSALYHNASHKKRIGGETSQDRAFSRRESGEVRRNLSPTWSVLSLIINRAYIAASRRSDRALGPRVESARRASEIHKRRTGRSLRITEADVMNEEMYEEEVDLPMHYDRLMAHLQTQNASFDHGLAAYLTSHVAMRATLDRAMWRTSQHDLNTINKSQYRDTDATQSPQQYMLAGQTPLESWAQSPELGAQAKRSIVEPLSTQLPTNVQALLAITPIDLSFDNTMPSSGMHQQAFNKRSYTYKPNSRQQSNTPSSASQIVTTRPKKDSIESVNRASAPQTSASDASSFHSTIGRTLSHAGFEFNEKGLEKVNVSTMEYSKVSVDHEGSNGSMEPSETGWENFFFDDAPYLMFEQTR